MTFNTTEKNSFKKDPLRGLQYKQTEYARFPFVQVSISILLIMAMIVVMVIWRKQDKKPPMPEFVTGTQFG